SAGIHRSRGWSGRERAQATTMTLPVLTSGLEALCGCRAFDLALLTTRGGLEAPNVFVVILERAIAVAGRALVRSVVEHDRALVCGLTEQRVRVRSRQLADRVRGAHARGDDVVCAQDRTQVVVHGLWDHAALCGWQVCSRRSHQNAAPASPACSISHASDGSRPM